MSKFYTSKKIEKGYVLLGVIILMALAAIIVATSLGTTSTLSRAMNAAKERSVNYYDAEETLGSALSWLRENSTGLALLFGRNNFYSSFDRSTPGKGANDTGSTAVETKVKVQGSSNSAILASSDLATSDFPVTTDAATGASFDPKTVFSAASLGSGQTRITLVDAIPVDSSKDFGDPDLGNPMPQTEFNPLYRVDAMNALNSGAHVFGYVVGTLIFDYGVGFYGRDFVEARQVCDSYLSNNGAYGGSNRRANCTVGSNGTIKIHSSEIVYGTARTNGSFNEGSPYGGKVCSDFVSNCPNKGTKCAGPSCKVPGLPTYSTWNVYCPTNQGDVTVNSNATMTVAGNAANQKCWGTVTIGNKKVLTLKTTAYSYFIDTFDIPNTGKVNFSPDPSTGTINLYVRRFVGDKFNGNQVFNVNNKPYQLRIHYLGNAPLVLNGTAAMSAFVIAPYAPVTVTGSFDFKGGIKATALTMTGSGDVHFDESGDITTISDTSYQLRQVEQRYR